MSETMLPTMASHISTRKPGTRDGLDFLPTPPWATRALCEKIKFSITGCSVWEPACGKFDMVHPLQEYFESVWPSDIVDRGHGNVLIDFTNPDASIIPCDWIITNPPFNKAVEFILLALKRSRFGVAMLVRTNFLEGIGHYMDLFKDFPPTRTLQFVERVPMFVDRLDPEGSTMTSYMWLVWEEGCARKPMEWIEPCRTRLEKVTDYDQYLPPLPILQPPMNTADL